MKIGVASDVEKRLQELQIGNHEKLRVSAVFPGFSEKQAAHIEHQCHQELKKRRLHRRGEWFLPNVRECKTILRSITGGSRMIDRREYELGERGGRVS